MFSLIDHLGVGVVAQRDARVIYANVSFVKMLNYDSVTGLLGRSVWDIVHPKAQEDLRDRLRASLLGDTSAYFTNFATANGTAEPACVVPRLVREGRNSESANLHPMLVEVVLPLRDLETVDELRDVAAHEERRSPRSDDRRSGFSRENGPRFTALNHFDELTHREIQVVDGITAGLDIPRLAKQLEISPNTVRNHLKSIFRKLRVRSQTELLSRLITRTRSERR